MRRKARTSLQRDRAAARGMPRRSSEPPVRIDRQERRRCHRRRSTACAVFTRLLFRTAHITSREGRDRDELVASARGLRRAEKTMAKRVLRSLPPKGVQLALIRQRAVALRTKENPPKTG